MGSKKCYGVGVPTNWMFLHRNNELIQAIGKCVGVFQDIKNDCQVVLYGTKEEALAGYKRLNALGSKCFVIENPAYVDERFIK